MKLCLLICNLAMWTYVSLMSVASARAAVPVTITDNSDERNPASINDNFTEVNRRIGNADLTSGGSISGNLSVSGDISVSGTITVPNLSISTLNVTYPINNSTATTITASYTGAGYAYNLCVATLSMTTDAVPVEIIVNGICRVNTSTTRIKVLEDGAIIAGYPESYTYDSAGTWLVTRCGNSSWKTGTTTVGTHSWCLTVNNADLNAGLNCTLAPCTFEVREVH